MSDLIKSLDLFEHRTDNNQLQVRRLNKNETQRVLTDESPKQSHFESSSSQKDSNNVQSSENPEKNTSGSLKNNKPNFSKIIPIVQNAIDACADPKGWARLGEVLKYLELHIQATQYGFDNTRELIHSIYDDWLEIKKLGRGERIRINKRFISKNE